MARLQKTREKAHSFRWEIQERNERPHMYQTPEYLALRREYLQNAAVYAKHLRQRVQQLREGGADLDQLRKEVHKLRGSGGFFGFRGISEAAAQAEDAILPMLSGEAERDDRRVADLVERLVEEIDAAVRQEQK